MSQEEIIRENAGDAMNRNIQSPEGTKDVSPPDSNSAGVPDPEPTTATTPLGSVEQETAALSEEAREAQEYFAGVAGDPGSVRLVESEADAAQGAPTGDAPSAGFDTAAPERAQEGDKTKGDEEPSTGEMYAGVISSDPNMQWESKMAEKLSGAEGVTAPRDES
jgi:hypothetical protein